LEAVFFFSRAVFLRSNIHFSRLYTALDSMMRVIIAIISLIIYTVGANVDEYSGEYKMTGKLESGYQPYGVWYDDLTSARSQTVINNIVNQCQQINESDTSSFSCLVVDIRHKTSGAWADFNVTLTSTSQEEVKSYGYSEVRVLLRQELKSVLRSVYQRVDHIPADIDRTWMIKQAVMVFIVVVAGYLVYAGYLAIKYKMQDAKMKEAKDNKASLLEEYTQIQLEKKRGTQKSAAKVNKAMSDDE